MLQVIGSQHQNKYINGFVGIQAGNQVGFSAFEAFNGIFPDCGAAVRAFFNNVQ